MNALRRWLPRFSLTTLLLSCVWLGVWLGLNVKDYLRTGALHELGWPVRVCSIRTLFWNVRVASNDEFNPGAVSAVLLSALFGMLLLHVLIDRPRDHPPSHVQNAIAQRQIARRFSSWSAVMIALWLVLAVLLNVIPKQLFLIVSRLIIIERFGWPVQYYERGSSSPQMGIQIPELAANVAFALFIAVLLWVLIDRPFRKRST